MKPPAKITIPANNYMHLSVNGNNSLEHTFNSALLSAFFNSWSKISALFLGHRPWEPGTLKFFACNAIFTLLISNTPLATQFTVHETYSTGLQTFFLGKRIFTPISNMVGHNLNFCEHDSTLKTVYKIIKAWHSFFPNIREQLDNIFYLNGQQVRWNLLGGTFAKFFCTISVALQLFTALFNCTKSTSFQWYHTWAFLPTPPLNLLKGTICFLATTSLRYRLALRICMCLIAWAVSLVFLKCTRRFEPRALHDFVAFSGSAEYRPIWNVTKPMTNLLDSKWHFSCWDYLLF